MTHSKRHPCANCSSGDLHPIWDAVVRYDEAASKVTIWECRCCHTEIPRRTRRPSAKEQAKCDAFDALVRDCCLLP